MSQVVIGRQIVDQVRLGLRSRSPNSFNSITNTTQIRQALFTSQALHNPLLQPDGHLNL